MKFKSFGLSQVLHSTQITKKINLSFSRLKFLIFLITTMAFTQHVWSQIAQRGSATTNSASLNGSSRNLLINKPSGVVAGDVMIASIVQNETDNDNGGLTANTATGWTLVRGGLIRSNGTSNGYDAWFGTILYRIADGTEGANFSFVMPNDRADMAIGSIVAFSGVATNALRPDGTLGGPFDVVPQPTFNLANSATATATSLTVANNNSASVMIAMVNNDRNYDTWSNAQTELFDNTTTNGDDASVGAAWTPCVSIGATGDRTVTISSSDRNSALLLVLRRASALTVGEASSTPTLCVNTALTNITHSTTGATGIGTATGLPAGVTATWASNTITISGTPTSAGTFNYSIPLTGGCSNATGTIRVNLNPTASATASNSTICAGNSIDLSSLVNSNNLSTTIAFNGFESGDTWGYSNTNGSTKTGTSASDALPASTSYAKTGTYAFGMVDGSSVLTTSNVTGIASYTNKQFRLNLAGFSGNNSNGLDLTDIVTVAISLDGGTTFSSELTVTGNGNAYWGFTTGTGIAEITYDGNNTATNFAPTAGGPQTSNGFSTIIVNLPNNAQQFQVKVTFLNNNTNEEWIIDDLTLTGTPNATYSWTSNPSGFSSSVQNPAGLTPSVNTTYTLTATNIFGCSNSVSTVVTVSNVATATALATDDYVWNGKVNNEFTSASNWLRYNGTNLVAAQSTPTNNTNLIIPNVAQTCVFNAPNILNNTANVKNLTIETGGSLTIGTGSLDIHGNYSNSGAFTPGTGMVTFSGQTGNQIITKTGGETFTKLKINKASGNVILANNVTVTSELSLIKGLLVLGSNDLILGGANVVDHSSQSYVTTSSTGKIKRNVGATATIFPVGNSSYNPAIVTNTGTADVFSLRVIDNVTDDGTGIGTTTSQASVKRTWMVDEAAPGGSNVTLRLYWNGVGEEIHGFDPAEGFIAHYIASAGMWDNIGFTSAPLNAGYFETNNITSFSPFTISSSNTFAPLPIELVSFQANCAGDDKINVTWTTASEHNTSHYIVEHSRNGNDWEALAMVEAAVNSTSLLDYKYVHENPIAGTNYYRLTQYDNDGAFEQFNAVAVDCDNMNNTTKLSTYPNPSAGSFYVSLSTEEMEGAGVLTITDSKGTVVHTQDVNIQNGNSIFNMENLQVAPGMYYIQITNGSNATDIVKHSLR